MIYKNGDVVVSLKGRDEGTFYVVLNQEDKFVWVADGKHKKLENSKRKNAKHLLKLEKYVDTKVFTTNKQVSHVLKQYKIDTEKEGRSLV